MSKLPKILLLFLFLNSYLVSQDEIYNPIADSLFKSGIESFKLGLNARSLRGDTAGMNYFFIAYMNFNLVISLGLNHRTTASYIMASKSLCYLDMFAEAEKLLKEFIGRFSESEYIEDAFYTLALVYVKLGDYKQSLLYLDRAVAKIKSEKQKYTDIALLVIDSMKASEILEIEKFNLTPNVRYLIVKRVSDKIASTGKIEEAKNYVIERLSYFERTEFYEKALLQANYFDRLLVRPRVKIGVLLPEKDRDLSKSILRGLEIAVEEHNLISNPKVGLDVKYYTTGDVDQKLVGFKNSDDVLAIVGPLYSMDVELCARFGDEIKIPVISPTAMSDGLTKLSKYLFQLNSNYTIRSKALAQFAIYELGIKNFVILTPDDKSIKPFVDAFVDEVEKNLGKIITIQTYNSSETDLRPQFRNLVLKINSFKNSTLSGKNASINIGLFAPILRPEFIGIISSQVYYHDLEVKVLGNDIWNNFEELYMNRRYTDGVVFTSGQYIDKENLFYRNFVRLFTEKFNFEPDEFAVYGYDTGRLILSIINAGKLTAEEIYETLKSYEIVGVGRSVIFDSDRVNKSIPVLLFKDGMIKKLSQWVISQ